MKAKIYFDEGLLLPKVPVASMLFLEFVRDYSQINKVSVPLTIQEFDMDNNSFDELLLNSVNPTPTSRDFYFKAMEYVNANLS